MEWLIIVVKVYKYLSYAVLPDHKSRLINRGGYSTLIIPGCHTDE